jgi:hypothetical protein
MLAFLSTERFLRRRKRSASTPSSGGLSGGNGVVCWMRVACVYAACVYAACVYPPCGLPHRHHRSLHVASEHNDTGCCVSTRSPSRNPTRLLWSTGTASLSEAATRRGTGSGTASSPVSVGVGEGIGDVDAGIADTHADAMRDAGRHPIGSVRAGVREVQAVGGKRSHMRGRGRAAWADNTTNLGDEAPIGATTAGVGLPVAAVCRCAGYLFTCAVLVNESVICWGSNVYGQLGQGDTVSRGGSAGSMEALTAVEGGVGNARAAAGTCGRYHVCVLTVARGVRCLGYNADGQVRGR